MSEPTLYRRWPDPQGGRWVYLPVEPVAEMEVFDGDWVATVPVLPDGRYAIVKIGEADDE